MKGISLSLGYGVHCIIGPNGSGKTTLIRIIAGALKPSRGIVEIFGKKIRSIKDSVGLCIYVPSNPHMFLVGPRVRDDFDKILRISGGESQSIIDGCGLHELLDKRIIELSEGQKRVVAIASALLMNTRLILLDEPSVGLDKSFRTKMMNMLRIASKDKIIFIATNDLRIVYDVDTLILLRNGKIEAAGAPAEVLYDYGRLGFRTQIIDFLREINNNSLYRFHKIISPYDLYRALRGYFCST